MKRFFTLIAGILLVSSGAFAQDKWKNIITNGNMEGEQDPMWSSFWVHDWRQEADFNPDSGQKFDENSATEVSKGQFQGFAEIVEDPVKAGNHCARVIIRSKEEADAAGNPTIDNQNNKPDWTEWDSQFFVYATETIPEGKDIRLTLKVRGEKAGSFQTQAHYNPGNYNHYQLFGDVEYTTEWKQVQLTATVDANHTQEGSGKFFQSVAFNLSTMRDGNVIYFDDVKLQVRDHKEEVPEEDTSGWFDFLRNGTLSEDPISLFPQYTNFTGREGAIGRDLKARVVADPLDGQPSLCVTSINYNAEDKQTKQVEAKDPETGETILDAEGNPVMKDTVIVTPIYIRENGDTVKKNDGSLGVEDWATQFFATIPHVFKQNEKFHVKFSYHADKEATVQTQIHRAPGDYKHYQLLGDLNFTTEWQEYDNEITIDGNQATGSTIAFNCNVLKEVNNYYFRFEKFEVNKGAVTANDRTLKKEAIKAPVPAAEQEANVKIDMSAMMETLGIEDLVGFLNENSMNVMVKELIEPDDPEDDPEFKEGISGNLQATTGVFVNNYGSWIDEEDGISLTFPEEGIEGNVATLNIFNLNGTIQAGEPIDTKIYFQKNDWLYGFDLTLITPEEYEAALGVTEIKAQPKKGIIYDLTGRKVTKATKGLYIKDGKKFFIK